MPIIDSKKNKFPLLFIGAAYIFIRFFKILALPVFNDEAIYLHWGFKEVNTKGLLFYSLYDGKPPFLMWLFGLSNKLIADPLLAGRIISILAGMATLFGIYKICEKYFDKNTAIYASIFYLINPLFTFFDRQALMESAITAVGIWSLFFFLEFIEKSNIKNAFYLGLLWGIGLFVKQSALIFIIAEATLYFWIVLKKKDYKFNWLFISSSYVALAILSPLYFQKDFWASLPESSRFALTIQELFSFPVLLWTKNIVSIGSIIFWYLFLPLLIIGTFGLLKFKTNFQKYVSLFFVLCICEVVLLSRVISPRYLTPYLPLIFIFAGHIISLYKPKIKFLKPALIVAASISPVIFTTILITNPLDYFSLLAKVTNYSQQKDYVTDWTSGYGTLMAIDYIKANVADSKAVVGVRVDAGNPESAVFAYFEGLKNITPMYFDAKYTDPETLANDCLRSDVPFYFIARNDNLAGMDKFLVKIKVFNNPKGDNFVAVYILKNCENKYISK